MFKVIYDTIRFKVTKLKVEKQIVTEQVAFFETYNDAFKFITDNNIESYFIKEVRKV